MCVCVFYSNLNAFCNSYCLSFRPNSIASKLPFFFFFHFFYIHFVIFSFFQFWLRCCVLLCWKHRADRSRAMICLIAQQGTLKKWMNKRKRERREGKSKKSSIGIFLYGFEIGNVTELELAFDFEYWKLWMSAMKLCLGRVFSMNGVNVAPSRSSTAHTVNSNKTILNHLLFISVFVLLILFGCCI